MAREESRRGLGADCRSNQRSDRGDGDRHRERQLHRAVGTLETRWHRAPVWKQLVFAVAFVGLFLLMDGSSKASQAWEERLPVTCQRGWRWDSCCTAVDDTSLYCSWPRSWQPYWTIIARCFRGGACPVPRSCTQAISSEQNFSAGVGALIRSWAACGTFLHSWRPSSRPRSSAP